MLAVAAVIWLMREGRAFAFQNDEWDWMLHRRGVSLDAFLKPHNEHLSALPVAAYKIFFQIFGASSTLPYRLLAALLATLSATLLFVLVARRLGGWVALAAGAVVLFLGAGWNDLLWGFQIGYLGSLAAGLGAFALLERGGRLGDVLASLLLAVSLASSSVGLTVLVGAFVAVVLRSRERGWSRLWVPVAPTILYLIWYSHYGVSDVRLSAAHTIPLYAFQGLAAVAGSVTGLTQPDMSPYGVTIDPGTTIALLLLVGFAWRFLRGSVLPARFWSVAAVMVAFWAAAALSFTQGRNPNSSRYVYVLAPFLILAIVESLPANWTVPAAMSATVRRRGLVLLYVVALASIASNLGFLRAGANLFGATSRYERAELGVMDVARNVVAPSFHPEDSSISSIIGVHNMIPIDAKSYFSATDTFGSQADSVPTLLRQPDPVRQAADLVLVKAERLRLAPAQPPATQAAAGCARRTSAGGGVELTATPGRTVLLAAGGAGASNVVLRRFADAYHFVALGPINAGGAVSLQLPRDRSSSPWHVRILTPAPATVCLTG